MGLVILSLVFEVINKHKRTFTAGYYSVQNGPRLSLCHYTDSRFALCPLAGLAEESAF